jgi:hypothetical protein
MSRTPALLFFFFVVTYWPCLATAQQSEPSYILHYRQHGLPSDDDDLDFTGIRPQIRSLSVGPAGAYKLHVMTDRDALRTQSGADVDAALRDSRVRTLLGNRFVAVGGGEVTAKKGEPPSIERVGRSVNFYSYSRNRAVTVVLDGDRVVAITEKSRGFQPPVTVQEVNAAAAIVNAHPRYGPRVRNLRVRGIERYGEPRRLYLLFYQEGGRAAVFQATVDMSRRRVVSAGVVSR